MPSDSDREDAGEQAGTSARRRAAVEFAHTSYGVSDPLVFARSTEDQVAASSNTLHEDELPPELIDRHRAIVSIMEELEAVDWYDQRAAATDDPGLAAILAHNRDEEKEHASMALEWLRRHDAKLDEHLRTYLFTTLPVTEVEAAATGGGSAGASAPASSAPKLPAGSLGIGSLKGTRP
jgi:ferritin-like protein